MARRPYSKRTCESCFEIDVREWHRKGLLRCGQNCSFTWSRGGKPLAKIDVVPRGDALVLALRPFGGGQEAGEPPEQRVPIVWTPCRFGGLRPWFQCSGSPSRPACGRRAAKLYLAIGSVFACRRCHHLAYESQSERPAHRALRKARKLRMRLGGGPSLLDPLPGKPPRMHRWTYFRLVAKAIKAQECALGLEVEDIGHRFPGLLPPRAAARRASRNVKFFTPRALAAWNARARGLPRYSSRGAPRAG